MRRTGDEQVPRTGGLRFLIDVDRILTELPYPVRIAGAVVLTGLAAVFMLLARRALPDVLEIQFAGTTGALTEALDGANIQGHLLWDLAFIAAYTGALVLWAAAINRPNRARLSLRLFVYVLIAAIAAADLAEDLVTWLAFRRLEPYPWSAGVITILASTKWALVALLLVLAIGAVGHRLRPSHEAESDISSPGTIPRAQWPGLDRLGPDAWLPDAPPQPGCAPTPRIGIACSGGGIRSASFCLGALHGLGPSRVRHAKYLAAVSGGAYIAAGMTARALVPPAAVRNGAALREALAATGSAHVQPAVHLDPVADEEEQKALAQDPLLAGPLIVVGNRLLHRVGERPPDAFSQLERIGRQTIDAAREDDHDDVERAVTTYLEELNPYHWPLPFGQDDAFSDPRRGGDSDDLARLRARLSYLLVNGADGRVSVVRAVGGLLVNLAVLLLVLAAVGRPVGWAMSSTVLHPELRAAVPLLHDVHLVDALGPSDLVVEDGVRVECADGSGPGYQFPVEMDPQPLSMVSAASTTTEPSAGPAATVVAEEPGVVEMCAGRLSVISQPVLAVTSATSAVASAIDVGAAGVLGVDPDVVAIAAPDADLIQPFVSVAAQPTFTAESGSTGREKISIEPWMWLVSVGLLVLGLLTATFGIGILRGRHDLTTALPKSSVVPLVGAATVFLVTIGLPWVMQEIPGRWGDATSALPGAGTGIWGFVIWLGGAFAAAWGFATRVGKVQGAKTTGPRHLGRLVLKAAATVVLVVAGFVTLVAVLQGPVLNGPEGRYHDVFGVFWSSFLVRPADWQVLVALVGVLLITRRLVPTYVWSLNPLYRDRLGKAFLGDRRDRRVPVEVREATILGDPPDENHPWPDLVICSAVNLNSADAEARVPAGRWADSFTFSREAIGSPAMGFVPSAEYEATLTRLRTPSRRALDLVRSYMDHHPGPSNLRPMLAQIRAAITGRSLVKYLRSRRAAILMWVSRSRHTDLKLSSLVAVSGAAFSPGMGKQAYGAVGGVLAVLNLRLGLWLPSPSWVAVNDSWRVNAGWPYLLREVFGRYRRTSPYVYVTDGGHWENLGVVELIRRGCTEIYVLSAAGDGKESFATAGEAIALAREQFGVDIDVELTPLRARVGEDPPKTGRQLLDMENEADERVLAEQPYAVGRFVYPNGARARLLFIEATLTAGLPWDVHSHAERYSVFPDDSTANQFFNHRQFESYRRLGIAQARAGVESREWAAAKRWTDGLEEVAEQPEPSVREELLELVERVRAKLS